MQQELFPIYPGRTANTGRVYSAVLGKHVTLTKPMLSLVRALNQRGHLDPIRDGGRVGTYVALMDRGILRETRNTRGVHMPATTPEQVEEAAYAENARREAERAAHDADPERWVQVTDAENNEVHYRIGRNGQPVEIVKGGFRFWYIVAGQRTKHSAGGTFVEARAATDRVERDRAHADVVAEQEIAEQQATQATPAYQHFIAAVRKAKSYKGALELLHAEALDEYRARPLATGEAVLDADGNTGWIELVDDKFGQIKVNWNRDGFDWHTPDELRRRDDVAEAIANTPAEARTGISDRAAAALADVASLRRTIGLYPADDRRETLARLDRIEAALRAGK